MLVSTLLPMLRTHKLLRQRSIALSVTVVAALGVAPLAMACAFDLVKPERTAIDWIVDTETLVLAHAKPGNRFAFEIATVLVGPPDPSPIPHLVNSTLRRKLANDPEGKVLFAQSADGQWRRVAYVDVIFRDVLSTALANRDNWRSGMTQDRVDFVAGLQGSPDPRHRALLIGELDKVPYAQLRDLDLRLSDTELIADLWSPEGYAFQAIRALLLGMTGTDEARSAVSGVVERAMDGGTTKNLGAFAAAYIELGGTAAVRSLSNGFFGDASTSPLVLEQIVTAMSVHRALADDEGQREIDAAILDLVQSRPDAASIVAQQFGKRSDWTQVDALEPLMRNHKMTTKEALWTVSGYVVNARSTSREISVGSKKTKTFSQDPASSSSNVTTVGN